MISRKLGISIGLRIALASAFVVTSSVASLAVPVVFTGYDNNVSSVAQMTSSKLARDSFVAAVSPTTVVDFEGALPADLSITQGTITNNSGCGALCGFNTTTAGSNFLLLFGGTTTFNFSNPIDAFGFYITGLQTDVVIGQYLEYSDGSHTETILTPNAIGGGGAFIGFLDVGKLVTSVTYNAQAQSVGDVVAIDDVLYRGGASVPEPGSLLLLVAGLAMGGAYRFGGRRQG